MTRSLTQIPNLYYSKPISITINDVKYSVKNWVDLLDWTIRIAYNQGLSNNEFKQKYALRIIKNRGDKNRYHYVSAIDAWVQSLSSNDIVKRLQKYLLNLILN